MNIEFSKKEVCNMLEAQTRAMMTIPEGHTVVIELGGAYSSVAATVTIEKPEASND